MLTGPAPIAELGKESNMSYLLLTAMVAAASVIALTCGAAEASQGWHQVEHKPVPDGCIPVSEPGSYAEPGKTYVLTRDISSPRSAIFLGKDVTLDLNGYTITYADGPYEHVPNYGFEEGLTGWDVSKAPSAKVEDTDKVKPFIGKKILRMSRGEEIVSQYVTLPESNRSYYAMCGVLDRSMSVRVSVEDESGRTVKVVSPRGERTQITCPQIGEPRLGGGFVFAWLHHIPAGKYRIRVKAGRDCLLDEIDIRPAMDVGVGIVGKVLPDASYRLIYNPRGIRQAAFADYLKPGTADEPADGIPKVSGKGTVTIRNGVIRTGTCGIRSWGIQATADDVKLVVDNVKFICEGINTHAINAYKARLTNCRFETNTPFIINRHRLIDSPVSLRNADGSEVAYCDFLGGQGNLYVKGRDILIHDNLFVNRQTVTNHYSVMLGGCDGVKIYRNRFEPEIGSGLTIYVSRNNEVYENTFKITAANGNCEYTNEVYSTNAIRITDYNTRSADRAGFGNKIHHNKFHIVGKYYGNYPGNVPITTALFCSVGGGDNQVYDNEVVVDHQALDSPAQACAFYLGGSRTAGEYYNNKITTNVAAFWLGTPYGDTSYADIHDNTIIKADGAPEDFKPFRMGWGRYVAKNIIFQDNKFVNCRFGIQATDKDHVYVRK